MAKKPETLFKEKIKPLLEALPNTYWLKTNEVSTRGVPDFLGCVNGHFIGLELKKDGESQASELQLWTLKKIIRAGGIGIVCYPEIWAYTLDTLRSIATGKASYRPTSKPLVQPNHS